MKYRILAFDGGGARGSLTATLLKRLNDLYPSLIGSADLFAGTSVGSFFALGLACGLSADDMVRFNSEQNWRFIFTPERPGLFRPKYDIAHLTRALAAIFPRTLRLGDLDRHVLVTSFRVAGARGENWTPVLFHNFPASPAREVLVLDAALASGAAPVYFPSHKNYVDGAVVANNPSAVAISLAVDRGQELGDIRLLSIGTGLNPERIDAETTRWGASQWILTPSPPFPLIAAMLNGGAELDVIISSQLLGKRFFRLNPPLPRTVMIDDYKAIPELVALGETYDLGAVAAWIEACWL
ncbi:MAG: patatin-like phospholipase family protein [Desulfotomaculales bacterium]